MKKAFVFLLIFLTSSILNAKQIDFWNCKSSDARSNTWQAQSKYLKKALNLAYDGCKKASLVPKSCIMSRNNCLRYYNGSKRLWQCSAIDFKAKLYPSSTMEVRYKAALDAKEYCKKKSSMPATCFINMATCKTI